MSARIVGLLVVATVGCGGGNSDHTPTVCAGSDFVYGGVCVTTTGSSCPFDLCDAADAGVACVDTSSDPLNCGSCGVVCGGEVCAFGACQPVGYGCEEYDLTNCASACVDVRSHVFNCGGCGVPCPYGAFCASAKCQAVGYTCESAGLVACGYECVDTETDPHHCGGCGLECPSGVCQAGGCV